MVITIQIWFELTRFRINFSVCSLAERKVFHLAFSSPFSYIYFSYFSPVHPTGFSFCFFPGLLPCHSYLFNFFIFFIRDVSFMTSFLCVTSADRGHCNFYRLCLFFLPVFFSVGRTLILPDLHKRNLSLTH